MENEPAKIHEISNLDKAVKISIIMGALVVALSIAYYLVIFLPQKEKMALEQQKQEQQLAQQAKDDAIKKESDEKIANRNALNTCLDIADFNYSAYWDRECKGQGLKANCLLPQYNADNVERAKKTEQDNCFKKYPQ